MIKSFNKEYYRPQFVREQWSDLNGEWSFVFDDSDEGIKGEFYKKFPACALKILVPFTYETPMSGIADESKHEIVWYNRKFTFPTLQDDERYLINFEGVDYEADVWVNGTHLGSHTGGACRFTLDATHCIKDGENQITVRCKDSFDTRQPRGKQRWLKDSFGCWYVQTTGIWKPVWSEIVSATRLERVKISPILDSDSVRFDFDFVGEYSNIEIEADVSFEGIPVVKSRMAVHRPSASVVLDLRCDAFDFKTKHWHPCEPNLYDVDFTVYKNGKVVDRVASYFGFRKIEADKEGIRLNNVAIYQKLLLAQNYWRKSGYTMPDYEAALHDVEMIKAAGFNGIRIHQKIEDERYITCCDIHGILVWAEFPAEYEYGDVGVTNLTTEWMEAVKQQYNHPSIITWVPFNESWGIPNVFTAKDQQAFTRGIYWLTKAYDPMRPVITNDGWEHTCSDIITLHDYDGDGSHMMTRYDDNLERILTNKIAHGQYKFAFAQGNEYQGQPIIISEYGGIALAKDEGWGYNGKVADVDELVRKYDDLTSTIKSMRNVCGYAYTQLTDTYQEVNGLLDVDHNPKLDLTEIKKINDK